MKILDIITEAKAPAELPAELQAIVSNWIAKNPDKVKAAQPNLMKRYNPNMITLFKNVLLYGPIVQLNLNLYALEQIAAEPLQTFRASSPAFAAYTQEQKDVYIKEARDLYYGIFAAQMVIPALMAWVVKGTKVIAEMFGLLEAAHGKVGGKLGAIVNVAGILAITGFMGFLGSPQGIAWMSDSIFMPIIRMSGSATAWTWDWIWPKIQELTGLRISDVNPATTQSVAQARTYGGLGNYKMMDPQEFKQRQDNMYNDIKNDPTLSYSRFK
jgi:hypothetical protein